MLSFFNSKRKPPDHPEHDTLFKVSWAMDLMAEGIRATWNVGKQVTIDESMIRYMGRAVEYRLYCKGATKEMQSIEMGMCTMPGADL
jgi:hypothetical protein